MMQRADTAKIRPGAWFHQVQAGRVVATAAVMAIVADGMGIPHVRFTLGLASPNGRTIGAGERVLSLTRFAAIYSRPVA